MKIPQTLGNVLLLLFSLDFSHFQMASEGNRETDRDGFRFLSQNRWKLVSTHSVKDDKARTGTLTQMTADIKRC